MSQVGRVFRHALVFGTAPVLQKLAGLLLLPYFTHFLGPEDYGAIELIAFWTGVFLVLFGAEYRAGFLWRFAAAQGREAQQRVFTAAAAFGGAAALLAAAAFALAGPPLLRAQLPHAPGPLLLLSLGACLTSDLVGVLVLAALQAEQRAARMVALSLVQFTLDALLKILFVAVQSRGVDGFFLAGAIASAANTLLALHAARGLLTTRVTAAALRAECAAVLRYSAPLLLGALAYLLMRRIDRPMTAAALSVAALGVYGRATRLAQLVSDFYLVPFQRSFDVWRLEIHAERGDPEQVAHVYRWFVLGAGLVATGVATFGCDLFTGLADESYRAVREQVPLLIAAMLCQCGVTVVASAFFVTKQTAAWMRVMLAGLAIQVLAVLLLARPLGIPGVALALAGAQAFLYWAAARFGGRLWPVPYRHREAILTMGVASAVSVVRIWLPGGPLWLAATVDAALVGGYLVLALPLCRVGRGELALLRSWLLDRGSTR